MAPAIVSFCDKVRMCEAAVTREIKGLHVQYVGTVFDITHSAAEDKVQNFRKLLRGSVMKNRLAIMLAIAALGVTCRAGAAVITVKEFPDRFVAEIDGSMDPKAVVKPDDQQGSTSAASVQNQHQPQAIQDKPSARAAAAARIVEMQKQGDKPYSRAERVMEYLAKIPNRTDYVEGRLEAVQTRWAKRQSLREMPAKK